MAKLVYTLYVNVGSWSIPVIGSGFIVSNANIESSSLSKTVDDGVIFERISNNGTVIFKGIEYYALKLLSLTELKVGVKFYEGSNQIFEGFMSLSSGSFDDNSKIFKNSISEFTDNYTEIDKNMDSEVNILNSGFTVHTLNLNVFSTPNRVWGFGPVPLPPIGWIYCPLEVPDAWIPSHEYLNPLDYDSSWVLDGGLTYFALVNHISDSSNRPPNALYWLQTTVFYFVQQRSQFPISGYTYNPVLLFYQKASCTQDFAIISLTRFRKMFDVLKSLVQLADPTINIDETGVNEYCNYLNLIPELKNLYISAKSDIKKYNSTDIATVSNIDLKRILEIYKLMFNLDWKIEGGYFKFVYNSSLSKTTIGIDATNYKGKNWTIGKSKFNYLPTDEINKETWKFEKSGQDDFDGVPITYDIPYSKTETYNLDDINTNIAKVLKDDDEVSDSGYVIVSADISNNVFYTTGLLTGNTILNGRLSLAQLLVDHHLVGRPFNSGLVNRVLTSLTTKRNREQEIKIPIDKPDDVDFDKLLKTDLADLEVYTLNINFDGSFALIKGRY